jgi:methylated-DNA-[protein]-cysteine S-methyltransferase
LKIYTSEYQAPVGVLYFASSDKGLVQINLLNEDNFIDNLKKIFSEAEVIEDHAKNQKAIQQLTEYFDGSRRIFDLPFDLVGTDFQKKVWLALSKIPFGKTVSYKQIAENIGNPKAVRAVGLANNRNPIPIIIPCHRVIGANGNLVGYGGGLEMKRRLLIHEGVLQL